MTYIYMAISEISCTGLEHFLFDFLFQYGISELQEWVPNRRSRCSRVPFLESRMARTCTHERVLCSSITLPTEVV